MKDARLALKEKLDRVKNPMVDEAIRLSLRLEEMLDYLLSVSLAYQEHPEKLKELYLSIAGRLDEAVREFTDEVLKG